MNEDYVYQQMLNNRDANVINRDNDSKVMRSTKECALQIVKVKIYTKYEQGKKN